jgi:hypothetical protein
MQCLEGWAVVARLIVLKGQGLEGWQAEAGQFVRELGAVHRNLALTDIMENSG